MRQVAVISLSLLFSGAVLLVAGLHWTLGPTVSTARAAEAVTPGLDDMPICTSR